MKMIVLVAATAAVDVDTNVDLKAASPYTNYGCQCDSLTFTTGRTTHGNCFSTDKTGAKWCYLPLSGSTCTDSRSGGFHSTRFPGRKWSYEACATPAVPFNNNNNQYNNCIQRYGQNSNLCAPYINNGGSGFNNNGGSGFNNGGSGFNNGGSGFNNGCTGGRCSNSGSGGSGYNGGSGCTGGRCNNNGGSGFNSGCTGGRCNNNGGSGFNNGCTGGRCNNNGGSGFNGGSSNGCTLNDILYNTNGCGNSNSGSNSGFNSGSSSGYNNGRNTGTNGRTSGGTRSSSSSSGSSKVNFGK